MAGILALAVGARLWGLADYPPGLYPDQAANGEDALEILDGRLQVYSPRNNGRESLFFYVQAVTVGLFGVGVWPLFLASAVVGVATVGVTYLAGARLFGRGPALLAAFFLATNPWHVTLSRTGFRAVLVPLFVALALWFWGRVFRPKRGSPSWRDGAAAGAFTALGLYTYPAFRAFGIFLVLASALGCIRVLVRPPFRARVRRALIPLVLATVTGFLVATPLLAFFRAHPEFVALRAGHVSIFNPDLNNGDPWGTFLRMTGRTLRAFAWDGDGNPRHDVPLPGLPYVSGSVHHYTGGGAPFLSLVPAVCALVGLVVALRRTPWLVLLFLVMLLPAVTTAEGIPHGLRTAGAIPSHAWLAGIGGAWLWERRRSAPWHSVRLFSAIAAIVLLAFTAASDVWLYFGVARNAALAHYEYRGDLTEVSQYLTTLAVDRMSHAAIEPLPFLVLDDFSVQTVHFLTTPMHQPYRLVRPEVSHEIVLKPGEQLVFTQSSLPDASRYLLAHRDARVFEERANRFGETVLLVVGRES